MPAAITILSAQLRAIMEEANDAPVVVNESGVDGVLDVWVLDEESMSTSTHRSVVIDEEGNVIGDHRQGDYE